MDKRILVTGANGYIGRHVVKASLEQGYTVLASDFSNSGIDSRAVFMDTSIFSKSPQLFKELGFPNVLIHMAWKDGFIHNSPAHMSLLSDHVDFLNYMVDQGIESISVMGSMHEIGYWEGSIDEHTPCSPITQYGIAKNALRQSFLLYTEDKPVSSKWLRGYYIFGDDLNGSSIFAKLQQANLKNQKTFPFTSGKNKYDFISVTDLAEQIVAASTQNEIEGIINVCSGIPRSLGNQVEEYIQSQNLDITLQYNAFPDRAYDSPCVWGDSSKIKKIMNINK